MRAAFAYFVLFALSLGFSTIIRGQETTITIGIPGQAPGSPYNAQSISTAQIDPYLARIPGQPLGITYTRDKANQAFASYNNLKSQLTNVLISQIAAESRVRTVESVVVNANPLKLKITQSGTKFTAVLTDISINAQILVKGFPIVCSSARARFTVDSMTISGTYDVYTGNIENSNIGYNITNQSVDCTGIFGFVGNVLDSIFNISGPLLQNAVRSAVNSATSAANMQRFFSVKDLLEGLRNFSPSPVVNSLANQGIDIANRVLGNPNLGSLGLQLNFELQTGTSNLINFIGSHQTPVLTNIEYYPSGMIINYTAGSNTGNVYLYALTPGSTSWIYVSNLTDGINVFVRPFPKNTKFSVIAESTLISGLRSLPSNSRPVTWDYYCRINCPDFP